MLLAFDIGNSNTVLGVFKDGKLVTNWRIETDPNKSADEYGMLVRHLFDYEGLVMSEVRDVIISTVVPSVQPVIRAAAPRFLSKKTGIPP